MCVRDAGEQIDLQDSRKIEISKHKISSNYSKNSLIIKTFLYHLRFLKMLGP